MTSTEWPAASTPRIVLRNVITTPLTCGVQASVASRMRNGCLLVHGRLHRGGGPRHYLLPMQDGQLPFPVLHERRETFDPVAVVAIQDIADRADLGLMDVSAYDSVNAAPFGFLRQGNLESSDIA